MTQPSLTVVSSKSLADQVADKIVEGIASGALKAGRRIVEAELANELGVSRVPIREALKILHAQGIVAGRPRYGVSVAAYDDRKIVQIYEIRCAFEKIAIRDAKRNANMPVLLRKLDESIAEMDRCLQRGDLLGVSKADLHFHHEICRASQNDIVLVLWEALSRHMLIVFEQELLGDAEQASIVDHHRAFRRSFEELSVDALEAEIEGHIMRLRNVPHQETVAAAQGA